MPHPFEKVLTNFNREDSLSYALLQKQVISVRLPIVCLRVELGRLVGECAKKLRMSQNSLTANQFTGKREADKSAINGRKKQGKQANSD